MSNAISIEGLSKEFQLRETASYATLRDRIAGSFSRISKRRAPAPAFRALDDIYLEVEKGARMGVIGPNGAGKSTLLKIISRITPPTSGRITLNGRVASLLEVGTGFHPELSGRENIYLNGSLLGLKRQEINKKLDEIIAFSGVSQFIDQPLKRFSSGMELRLAFSVAAHLEAEILLVDEVLAVGDFEFQKKCIGKMEAISQQEGRTILFVSHNLQQLRAICNNAVVMDQGSIVAEGDIHTALSVYTSRFRQNRELEWSADQLAKEQRIEKLWIGDEDGHTVQGALLPTKNYFLYARIYTSRPIEGTLLSVRVTNSDNIPVYTTTNGDEPRSYPSFGAGVHQLRVALLSKMLVPGIYSIICSWNQPNTRELDVVANALHFTVENDLYPGFHFSDGRQGMIHIDLPWEVS